MSADTKNDLNQRPSQELNEKEMADIKTDDAISVQQASPSSLDSLDPELAAIISGLSSERRVEIEKRVKLKIDLILFPMLLIFYILNYLVRSVDGRSKFGIIFC